MKNKNKKNKQIKITMELACVVLRSKMERS